MSLAPKRACRVLLIVGCLLGQRRKNKQPQCHLSIVFVVAVSYCFLNRLAQYQVRIDNYLLVLLSYVLDNSALSEELGINGLLELSVVNIRVYLEKSISLTHKLTFVSSN
jgi:hypothetical protein